MNKLIFILFIPIFFFSCEKEIDLQGTIKGYVELSILNEKDIPAEGATVVLFDGVHRKEVVADANGIFHFYGIDEGYYSLSISYDGYGTYYMPDLVYTALGKDLVLKNITLYKIPEFDTQEAHITLTSDNENYTIVDGFITCLPGQGYFVGIALFFDKDSDVSKDNYTYSTFESDIKWVEGDTIFIKDFVTDLGINEKWYVNICVYNSMASEPYPTLKEAFNTMDVIVE